MTPWISNAFEIAINAIEQNKLRSLLTALGIIFGVAAVITMLSIGNGAKQEILKQLEIIGTNNIVVMALKPEADGSNSSDEEDVTKAEEKKGYSPGLHTKDITAIRNTLPGIKSLSLEIEKKVTIIKDKISIKGTCKGVNNDFFEIYNLHLDEGTFFNRIQSENGLSVCVIGPDLSKSLFLGKSPIGKYIKCQGVILKVIGVLKRRTILKKNLNNLKVSQFGRDVFIPFETYLLRYEDRAYVSSEDIKRGNQKEPPVNYHQLDRIVIKVSDVKSIEESSSLISRILLRRHNEQEDFSIEIPELLIKQQQSTQETLNLVLAIIAGISLLVGGIGIMNIMLSSVLERVKEIGVRRSLGAKRNDIIWQFLLEAILISLIGGIIGIFLGLTGSEVIGRYAEINAIVSGWSVFLSFIISFGVGLFFGFMPAQKAANLDPITAIRN